MLECTRRGHATRLIRQASRVRLGGLDIYLEIKNMRTPSRRWRDMGYVVRMKCPQCGTNDMGFDLLLENGEYTFKCNGCDKRVYTSSEVTVI